MEMMHLQNDNVMVANPSMIAKVRNPVKKDSSAIMLLQKVHLWLKRRENRSHLKKLPDYLLKDIGLTRQEVMSEYHKPFWKGGIF